MRALSLRCVAVGLYTLVWGVIYAGFLWRSSWAAAREDLHTPGYLALLVVGLVPFALPSMLRRMRQALGSWPKVMVALAPTLLLLVAGYVVGMRTYYATRTYPFHPFLQMSGASFSSIPKNKPAHTFRILVLGGSTTRDAKLQERDRYPTVLQRILQERHPKLSIEVLNGGMDWYTTEHALIYYAYWARDWNPDVVVFFEAINDIYRSCTSSRLTVGEYRSDYSHYYGPAISAYRTPAFESWPIDWIASYWYPKEPKPTNVPLEFFRSLTAHERNTRTLIRLLRADEKHVVVGTQASLFRPDLSPDETKALWFGRSFCLQDNKYPDSVSLMRAMQQANEATRRIAEEEDVPLAEIDAAVPKRLEFFRDDVHVTPSGARIVAETVAEAIGTAGYLQ